MRNLKRALSLVMAMALIVGMMVVSASAASKDFTDADEIRHPEAVNTMVALNVISGKEDGSYFDPTGTLTRAEMAKIISYVMNGGVEPNIGTKVVPTYSDIDNHWAEAYIEYCTSMGIINGDGAGKFNPGGTLTASQAAKMFLTAMGYNAEVFGLVGNDWETNTNRYANEAGLYENLANVAVSQPISRDDACQMAYNAIQSALMVRGWSQNQATGQVTETYTLAVGDNGEPERTLLTERFGGKIFIGIFSGNYDMGASNTRSGEIRVTNGHLTTENITENDPGRPATFPADLDISYIGEEVKVIFKDGTSGTKSTPDRNDTIYGVFTTGTTQVVNATKNDIDADHNTEGEIKVDGTVYDVADVKDGTEVVFYNYGAKTAAKTASGTSATTLFEGLSAQSGDTVKFVLNEGGEVYAAYVTESNIAKVTSISSTKVTMTNVGAIELEGNDVADGLAVGDIVVYTKLYKADKDDAYFTVAAAETVEGEISGYTGTEKVSIDGTSYMIVGKALNTSLTDDAMPSFANEIGTNVIAYLVNGMVAVVDKNDTTTSSYALVTGTNDTATSDSSMAEGKVRLMMSDGTTATYVVDEKSTVQADDVAAGDLVKYSVSSDVVKISEKVTAKTNTKNVWNADTKVVADNAVAGSDAVLYVSTSASGEYKVYNLRSLKTLTLDAADDVYYVKNSSGRITAAFVDLQGVPSGATTSTLYGMIIADNGVVAIDEDEYRQFVVWTGEEVTINLDDADTTLKAGDYVVFDESTTATYSEDDVKALETVSGTRTVTNVAVKEYSSSDAILSYYTKVTLSGSVYEGAEADLKTAAMDDDAVIIYVDRDGKAAGDEIGVNPFDTSTGYANVKMVTDKDGVIIALLVETSGECNVDGTTAALTE